LATFETVIGFLKKKLLKKHFNKLKKFQLFGPINWQAFFAFAVKAIFIVFVSDKF
jgi:hypothetical protein